MKTQLTLLSKETLLILVGVLVALYAFKMSFENRNDTQNGLPGFSNSSTLNKK